MTEPLNIPDHWPDFIWRWRRHEEFPDLLQECRARILEARSRFDPERGTWATWVFWQCRFALRTWRNGPHRDPPPQVLSLDVPAGDDADGAPLVELLPDPRANPELEALDRVEREQALASIRDSRRRRAFRLRIDGHTWREIGDRLGVSHEGARLIVRAAVKEAQSAGAI